MAVAVVDIRSQHQEFADTSATPDAVIQGAIDDAEGFLDPTVFGDQYDLAVRWYTCHLLAASPFSEDMRLQKDRGVSIYWENLERLMRAYSVPYRARIV